MALTDDCEIKLMGNLGCYLDENNIISFQTGMSLSVADTPDFDPSQIVWQSPGIQWLNVCGYNVCARGINNRQCEEIERDIKHNRLLPRLINKQVNMLYGKGPAVYIEGKEAINRCVIGPSRPIYNSGSTVGRITGWKCLIKIMPWH